MFFKLKKHLSQKIVGLKKEQQTKTWLHKYNIKIIEQNFICRGGEIDLIGLLQHKDKEPVLIFFEVKFRKDSSHGHPSEFVTHQQQQRILRCAETFLLKYPQYSNYALRFDVISFEGKQTTPEWLENAFGA